MKFTWHPSLDAGAAQEVELRFEPEGAGTHVLLISDKWENSGKNAHRARKGYDVGLAYVLNVRAEKRTAKMAVLDGLTLLMRDVELVRGGTKASIVRAPAD